MPRIYDSENNALDYCKRCFPTESQAAFDYDPGGYYGWDCSHPDYDEENEYVPKSYECEDCGVELKTVDN